MIMIIIIISAAFLVRPICNECFVLQGCKTCQNFARMAEANVSSSEVPSSSTLQSDGSPAEVNSVPFSLPVASSAATNILPQLTDLATELIEFLNNLPVIVDNGNSSDRQDVVQDLSSALCNSDTVTAETLPPMCVKLLCDLKKSAELLNKSNQQTNGSDSGHDDSNSLPPPDVSGDVVNGDTDADVPQQHLSNDALGSSEEASTVSCLTVNCQKDTGVIERVNGDTDAGVPQQHLSNDALGSNDEASTVSCLTVNCQKDVGVIEHAKSTLKPTPSIVQPVRTDVAFNAQGS